MENLTKHLPYKGTGIGRQNVTWNTAGSFVYALASTVLSFLIIQVMGDDQGDIFSFEFSTLGQQTFIVAYFGIRPFQTVNGTGEYSLRDYLEHRSMTCIMALGTGTVFLTFMYDMRRYTVDKCMILILLVMHKVIDGYTDVHESEFQRQGSPYLTGKSNFFRTLFSVSVSLAMLAAFGHLLLSCLVAVTAQAAGITLFSLDVIHALSSVDWNKREREAGRLSKSTSLLFISASLDFYVFSAVKYTIDVRLNNVVLGYSNLTFIPTSVIRMVANFVTKPFLTGLADLWAEKDYDCFRRELRRIGTIILGLAVLTVRTTAVLGKWVLFMVEMILGSGYERRLINYHGAFIIIVLGGGFYALAGLAYYALVIVRRQKVISTVYLAATATTAVLPGFLASKFGINGAAGCCLLLMMGLVTGFGLHTADVCQSEKKENTSNGGSNI